MKQKNNLQEEKAQALLEAYRNGDDSAFLSIYDMYVGMLLNYGACITTDKELVKDCVQDVFCKLINKRNQIHVVKISSYLIISLRNRLLDEFRRKNFMTETAVEDCRFFCPVDNVEDDYISMEHETISVHKVAMLMNELTPRQRQAFTLYYLEQRKYEEICQIMNMNYHSIRNLVHRGMLKLRSVAV